MNKMTPEQLDSQYEMIEQFQQKYANKVEIVLELKNGKEYIFSNDNFKGVCWNDENKETSFYYCPNPLKNFGYMVNIEYEKIRSINPVFRSFDIPMLNPTQRFEMDHIMKIKTMEEAINEAGYEENEEGIYDDYIENQNDIEDYNNPNYV